MGNFRTYVFWFGEKMKKVCTKCTILKNINKFSKDKSKRDGFCCACKKCIKKYKINYYKHNKKKINEKNLENYYGNLEKNKIRAREYYLKNSDTIKKRVKEYRNDNLEKIEEYRKKCKLQRNEYNKKYFKERMEKDINFRIGCRLRTRLSNALKRNYKSGSAVRDLGCSIEFLKQYLESKFKPGMT